MRRLLIACLVALVAIPAHAAETVLTLTARPGASFRVLTDRPARPVGSVILLAGGSGVLDLGDDGRIGGLSQNHLVRTRKAYVRAGYAIFVPDMAGDIRNASAYRFGAAHATDLAAVVAAARAVGGPVFVIGTSRGSVSVVALFTRQTGPLPDGVVISSGTLMDNGRMRGAASAGDLGRIRVPVLLLRHESDSCAASSPRDADRFKASLTGARSVEIVTFSGGGPQSAKADPCGPQHYHGFLGIEDQVVARTVAWMGANAKAR
ncbi:MAG: alpha/beta hydrolase [Reyranellaceae bacterium]